MLEFVEKLTLYPWLFVRKDVTALQDAGFPDPTILHIVLGCAHFNYLNRMADGIGIRFEKLLNAVLIQDRLGLPLSIQQYASLNRLASLGLDSRNQTM